MERRDFIARGGALVASMLAAGTASAQTSVARPRVVIAGAGAAGLALASRLRRQMGECQRGRA
jgi:sulfide:quinone oxidoreductase